MRQCDRTVRNKTEDTSRVKALKAARDKRYAVCDRIYRKCYCSKQFNEIPKKQNNFEIPSNEISTEEPDSDEDSMENAFEPIKNNVPFSK